MSRFERLRILILGADPALLSLRMSSCIVISMAFVAGILILIGKYHPLPRPAYVLALIATMQGVLQINDATASARAVTRIYAALAAFGAIAAISAVHDSLRLINVVLVIVVFAATYAQRFGARWRGVGGLVFMCAVVAAFLREDERDLRTAAAALAVSGLVVQLMRSILIPDNPARDFRRLVAALLSVSKQLREFAWAPGEVKPRHRANDLRLLSHALSTDTRACEAALPLKTPGDDAGETAIALKLLDLQVAAETLIGKVGAPTDEAGETEQGVALALQEVEEAEAALEAGVAALPPTFPPAVPQMSPVPAPGTVPNHSGWLQDQTLRRSLQITLACAIAAILGEAISTERWFWAVMSAFLIFNNSQSGAAVAVRGLDRAWGTALGIVIGIALATLTHDHLFWLSAVLAISVFTTFFVARISYVAMSLFLTISLSLIYGLIGIFTPDLLVLRLEETAIGVASGALVALLLFPIGLHEQAANAQNRLLAALGDFLQTIAEGGRRSDERLTARRAAAVDQAVGTYLATTGPLRSTWSFGSMTAAGRDKLREAYVMAYAAHRLERSFRDHRPTEQQVGQLLALSRRLQAAGGKAPAAAEDQNGTAAKGASTGEQPEQDNMAGSSVAILSRVLDSIQAEGRPPDALGGAR